MEESNLIVGIGELVYDHIFRYEDGDLVYIGSNGGGSVFNLLVNLASSGQSTMALGVGGEDSLGIAAKNELNYIGIDTKNIKLIPNRLTRVIFETICPIIGKRSSEHLHSFSATCLICNAKEQSNLFSRIDKENINGSLEKLRNNVKYLCFDKMTNERVEIAKKYRQYGIKSVLDIGRIGGLRYLPVPQIASSLGAFDILLTPENVARSLSRRFGYKNIGDLLNLWPSLLAYISKGKEGMSLCYQQEKIDFSETPEVEVADDAGSGDAFLSHILLKLLKYDRLERKNKNSYDITELSRITKEAITELGKVLSSYGARGHILPDYISGNPVHNFIGMKVSEIQSNIDAKTQCPFCNQQNLIFSAKDKDSKNSKLKTGIKRNVGPLLLKRMFFVTERLDAITKCQNLLESEGTAYVIGTGGSYPVAAFISIVLNRHGKLFSQPMHPFNYIRIGSLSNYVIVVSYSGSTPDCGAVIRKALSMGVRNVVLLTGSGNPKLKNLLQQNDNNVISYRTPVRSAKDITIEPPKERGFISFAGTVSPCTLWVSAVVGSVEMANLAGELNEFYNMADPIPNIAELGKLIKEKPGETVSVLGGGFAWPAMLDIESKFVEGDLGNVMLHEVKDFSHGRFMSLLGNDNKSPIIVLGVGPWHEYEQLVLKTVEQGRLIISIRSIFNDILGSLELLVKVQFFARWLGEYFNKDISRPKPPRAGIKLYKWKGQLE